MTLWNQLLNTLDDTLGFPGHGKSTVKKVRQAYDNNTNEHVVWLEYRSKANPQPAPVRHAVRRLPLIRELLSDLPPESR